jgi:hypothetical protein
MIVEVSPFGSGYTINDMEVGPWAANYMMTPFDAGTPGIPSDILAFGGWEYQSFMVQPYNYTWPNEDEVKLGVEYGVTAERTGTYSGATTYSRGRVVNESH